MFARNRLLIAGIAGLLLTSGGLLYAQEVSVPTETVITSDRLMFDYGRSTCVFEGNVVVTEPRVKLECGVPN